MDEPTRRAWSKPELIVLVRSGPEEAVLDGCKGQTIAFTGPQQNNGYCLKSGAVGEFPCPWCSEMANS